MTDDNLQTNSSQEPIPVELEDGTHYYDPVTGQEIPELFEPGVFDDEDEDDEDYDFEDDDEDDQEDGDDEKDEEGDDRESEDEKESKEDPEDENSSEQSENGASEETENVGEEIGEGTSESAAEAGAEGAAEGAAEAGAEAAAEAGAEAAAEAAAEGAAEAGAEAAAGSTSEFWIPALIIIVILVQVVVFAMAFMGYGDANTPSIYPAGGTVAKGKGYSLQKNTDYSGTPCAPGTTDNGIYIHPTEKFIIRKCATAGLGIVASINSQNIVNMLEAAKKDGVNLTGSSFRSYEDQIRLREKNCADVWTTPPKQCEPDTAFPGHSMHEKGLATDFDNIARDKNAASYIWLAGNASKFGYYNYPPEPWHWSTSGG